MPKRCKHELRYNEVIEAITTHVIEDGVYDSSGDYGRKIDSYVDCVKCDSIWRENKSTPKFITKFSASIKAKINA